MIKNLIKQLLSLLNLKDIKINIGSAGIIDNNSWIATDIHNLNITKETDWNNVLRSRKAKYMVAEHVWEHLSDSDTEIGNKLCFKHLKKGGVLRIAVPDGFHPNIEYINYVKPGGNGAGADDHKILYNYKIMTTRLEQAGFEVNLLEYWDEESKFHYVDWSNEGGKISRSRKYDLRNQKGELKYTSLIVDAIKK